MSVSVQFKDFDVSQELDGLRSGKASVGAVVCFVGTVRDMNENETISEMELEHYPGMTEKILQNIVDEAKERFPLQGVRVIHRIGILKPMDQIVLAAVAAMHRTDAFSACAFIMDHLKVQTPLWKREQRASGSHWVKAKEADEQAAKRWDKDNG